MLFQQAPPSIPLNWIKRFYAEKLKQQFGDKVQDCKDGSGVQFIKFNFTTGDQEIKIASRVEF